MSVMPVPTAAEKTLLEAFPRLNLREIQVWRELIRGGNLYEVANTLGLSHHTIKMYSARLMTKIGCRTRPQAVYIGMKTGWFAFPPIPADQHSRPLSLRERQVFQLICEGLDYQQISTELGISPATAKTHVQRVGAGIGTHRQSRIILRLYREGQIK